MRYRIPNLQDGAVHIVEETVHRSRFIATLAHASDEHAAREVVERVRRRYADATHNCWAFAAGPPGDGARVGFSDDGEPHGTAGKPMLNVLLHADVGEVAAVVTRYFGGIKLGTGGLVRAYGGMVAAALGTLPTRERVEAVRLQVVTPHAAAEPFKRLLEPYEAVLAGEAYDLDAGFTVDVPVERREPFVQAVMEITAGEAVVEPGGADDSDGQGGSGDAL